MRISSPENYKFIRFEKSSTAHKKYDALLLNKQTGKTVRVSFGDNRYQQYKDRTGLGLYSHMDHHDAQRRKNYLTRHGGDKDYKYSSGWFSARYLW